MSLPVFVAESQGYFAAEGLTLKINEVIGGHRSLQQVLDGNAGLATCSEAVVGTASHYVKGEKSPSYLDFIYSAALRTVRAAGVAIN